MAAGQEFLQSSQSTMTILVAKQTGAKDRLQEEDSSMVGRQLGPQNVGFFKALPVSSHHEYLAVVRSSPP